MMEVLVSAVVIGAVAYAVWRDFRSVPTAAPVPESREGTLVARLAATEITRQQYVGAMERLAARDDVSHPLAVPPERS